MPRQMAARRPFPPSFLFLSISCFMRQQHVKRRRKLAESESQELYDKCKKDITADRLKNISADVINKYKEKNLSGLLWYASLLEFGSDSENISRLFARIIQVYHPDKLKKIHNEIDESYQANDAVNLTRFSKIYIFKMNRVREVRLPDVEPETDVYEYEEGDFGYREEHVREDIYKDMYDEEEYEAGDDEYGFIEAINEHIFGNLDMVLDLADLRSLDGEFDLAGCDIVDLDGIENCVHIVGLNLSANRIEKIGALSSLTILERLYLAENEIVSIEALQYLSNLRELDIAFNQISDISPLLNCLGLEYVNVIGNPLDDESVLREPGAKGSHGDMVSLQVDAKIISGKELTFSIRMNICSYE